MLGYDIYVFILCLLVFALLAGLSTVMLITIGKLTFKVIKHGLEDEKIKEEYLKTQRKSKKCKGIDYILSLLLCLILCVVFAFSLFVGFKGNSYSDTVPTLKVVNSASMAKKHEKNTYLFTNNLNNQFDTFDLVLTYKIPDEFDLKVYDIVVYEVDGSFLIHRIVRIEEPNDSHPNERYFMCQGDAVETPDRFPVRYEQMRGIYRGERIPVVGSFVTFMQSPAGWLCMILVVAALIITPIIDKKFATAKMNRLVEIGFIDQNGNVKPEIIPEVVSEIAPCEDKPVKKSDKDLDFKQRILALPVVQYQRFRAVEDSLRDRFEVKTVESQDKRKYFYGNKPIANIRIAGNIVYVYLALDPKEYQYGKYVFSDVSSVKGYSKFPMRFKLISEQHTDDVCELIKEKMNIIGASPREIRDEK